MELKKWASIAPCVGVGETYPDFRIKQLRHQMLMHSYIYYELDSSIWSDNKWQDAADELVWLQDEFGVDWDCHDDQFSDWTGDSGHKLEMPESMKPIALLLLEESKNKDVVAVPELPRLTATFDLFEFKQYMDKWNNLNDCSGHPRQLAKYLSDFVKHENVEELLILDDWELEALQLCKVELETYIDINVLNGLINTYGHTFVAVLEEEK